jgi:mannitol/fructose-specific phosphotransferase system IIA component (Ntr-type)
LPDYEGKATSLLLSEFFYDDVVKVNMEAVAKYEAIEELVDVLIDAHELRLSDRAEVIDAVFARERSLSTGMEHGVAVPHCAVRCVDSIVGALGTSAEGIPFDSLDGAPARLIILLVIPKGKFQQHVATLSGIAKIANDEELRERILKADTPTTVMGIIYEHDERVGS